MNAAKYIIRRIIVSMLLLGCMITPVVASPNENNSVISTEANIKSMEEYLGLIQSRVKGNWHPPKTNETIRLIARFRLLPSGQIVDIKIMPEVKNPAAELAGFQAVEWSTPFPQLTSPLYNKDGLNYQMSLDYYVRNKSALDKEIAKVSDQAEKYIFKGDWQSAINLLDSVLGKNPNNIELKQRLSELYSNQAQALVYKEPQKSLELANKAIVLDPKNCELCNRLMKDINKNKKAASENITSEQAAKP